MLKHLVGTIVGGGQWRFGSITEDENVAGVKKVRGNSQRGGGRKIVADWRGQGHQPAAAREGGSPWTARHHRRRQTGLAQPAGRRTEVQPAKCGRGQRAWHAGTAGPMAGSGTSR
jgi:hypothetical protein